MEEVDGPAVSLIDLLQSTAESSRLTAPDFHAQTSTDYLNNLVSLPLENLLQQPTSIFSETRTVENELTNLCFREYPTFISVHKCSSAVSSAFDDFSSSLGQLLDAVPALEEECRSFAANTTSIQAARGKAALVQEHQDKLVDLLEIPQLMDTCVRNGYYQEAMELAAHTESLARRYPTVPLVEDIAIEVEYVLQLMLAQLLALLREPVKLPTLVKAVSFLRRLGTIEESELSIVFLASRLQNFRIQLVHIERDRADPVRYIRKYIDVFREHVYDIISQFTAIFQDSADPSLLASFANQCVSDLVELVSTYIPRISSDPASMSSVLVQLGYCALSFSRVGLDFSSLITEPFASTTLAAFSQALSTATTNLSTSLRNSAKVAAAPTTILITPEHIPTVLSSSSPPPPPVFTDPLPPNVIAQFPPLALVMNAHLSALNSLRLLAPLDIYPRFRALQTAAFVAITSSIHQYLVEAVDLEAPKTDRPSHSRTPSSPRAHLLRRNTDTQLAPEVRTARRRETLRVCVAFADMWLSGVLPFLDEALDTVFEEVKRNGSKSAELEEKAAELRRWIDQHGEKTETTTNGKRESVAEAPLFGSTIAEEPSGLQTDSPTKSTTNGYSLKSPPPSPSPQSFASPLSPKQMINSITPDSIAGPIIEGTKSTDQPDAIPSTPDETASRPSDIPSTTPAPPPPISVQVEALFSPADADQTEKTELPSLDPTASIELPAAEENRPAPLVVTIPSQTQPSADPIEAMFNPPTGLDEIAVVPDSAPLPVELEEGPSEVVEEMEEELKAANPDLESAIPLGNASSRRASLDVPIHHGDLDEAGKLLRESQPMDGEEATIEETGAADDKPDVAAVDPPETSVELDSSQDVIAPTPVESEEPTPTPSEPSTSAVPSRAPSPTPAGNAPNGSATNAAKKKKKKKKGKNKGDPIGGGYINRSGA